MKHTKYTKELLEPLVSSSKSISDVLRKLGLAERGGNFATIKRNIAKFNIDCSHMTGQGWRGDGSERAKEYARKLIVHNTKHTVETSLVENIKLTSATIFRLFSQIQPEYVCSECNISDWNDRPIRLHIDHIDGNHLNNKPENLRWLCPNCHSQTDTFCGRNVALKYGKQENKSKKIHTKKCPQCNLNFKGYKMSIYCSCECNHKSQEKCDIDTIHNIWLENNKNFSKTSRILGISDNAIRKRLRKANLI